MHRQVSVCVAEYGDWAQHAYSFRVPLCQGCHSCATSVLAQNPTRRFQTVETRNLINPKGSEAFYRSEARGFFR